MRQVFLEKQNNWRDFREAEQKRRDDKAKKEALDRYTEIVAKSRARKEYSDVMFQQTQTVRSHTEAALVIQRAYRRMRLKHSLLERMTQHGVERRRIRRERAATTIQRSWRECHRLKVYQLMNYKKIQTSPVISLRAGRLHKEVASYQKGISITGACTGTCWMHVLAFSQSI